MVVYMVLTLLGESARFVDVKWSAIGNGICMLVPVGYVVTLILKWKKTEMSKGEKAGAIVNAVMGLMMTANILFWNSFMFW